MHGTHSLLTEFCNVSVSVFGVVSVVFLCSHPANGVARIFFIGGA